MHAKTTPPGRTPNPYHEARHWRPAPEDRLASGLTRAQENAGLRTLMKAAEKRWIDEAMDEHTFLLDDLRRKLADVPDIQPSHLEHIDTCIHVLRDALHTPTPHLDLSLLPPGHALSDDDLSLFFERRAWLEPALTSITLPARALHLPTSPDLKQITHLYAPDFAGSMQDIRVQPQWRVVQMGSLGRSEMPRRAGRVQDDPDPGSPAELTLIVHVREDDVRQQAFSSEAMRFVRQHPCGSAERAEAVRLTSALIHAVQWYTPALDLSQADPALLQRASHHGLFSAFHTAYGSRDVHAEQSAHRGITAYILPTKAPVEVKLPDAPGADAWRAELQQGVPAT